MTPLASLHPDGGTTRAVPARTRQVRGLHPAVPVPPPRGGERSLPRSSRRGEFRPDIEGLRAVAVLAVVLFHAGVPGPTGGYVGVDVFLVVSGFLITGMLWREVRDTGTVRLSPFYGARARRLLPACSAVLVATVL